MKAGTFSEKIESLAEKYAERIIEIRRQLHTFPELSFHEHNTALFIEKQLKTVGIECKRMTETGLVALIKGVNPDKKTVGLRADMDALPIQENTGLSFSSQIPGVMHACGHDIHTSSLVGTAFILNDLKNEFEGSVKLIFQPAEEVLPGGAKKMIEKGVLNDPKTEVIIGQHVYPELTSGNVGFKSGKAMASSDEIYIKIIGQGGHGAMPWKLIDPVLISSHLIIALQQIVSRNANAIIPSVLTFGKISADGVANVIPNEVNLAGTFRTFDENWRAEAHKKIAQITKGLVASMGGFAEIEIRKGYPHLQNNEKLTQRCRDYAVEYLGTQHVADIDMRTTSEDFSYFAQEIPGCFYRLGVNSPGNKEIPMLHRANFIADEESLKTGMGLMAFICYNELNR